MFKRIIEWFILALVVAMLSACGGDDSPSNLLSENAGDSGEDVSAGATDPTGVVVSVEGRLVIPSSNRKTTITITTFDSADNLATVSNVPFTVSVTGSAKLEGVPAKTDSRGRAKFVVTNSKDENVILTITGSGNFTGSLSRMLYFGGSVESRANGTSAPADGLTSIEIQALARDYQGVPIQVPVVMTFPDDSFAVASQAFGETDEQGEFKTQITNTVAQKTSVTPLIGGLKGKKSNITFTTTGGSSFAETLDLRIVENNVLANGSDEAVMLVIARDSSGTPIPNVPVEITSDSNTAKLSASSGESGSLFITGDTGDEGKFELSVSNKKIGSVTINATTSGVSGKNISASQKLNFLSEQSSSEIGDIQLDSLLNDGALANGEDAVVLGGQVLDDSGNPVSNASVSFISSGGSAKFPSTMKTDSHGIFFVSFTNTTVETFTVRVSAGSVTTSPIPINFSAVPEGEAAQTQPNSITLLASPSKQTTNSEIVLTAIVRDKDNTPIGGIDVSISASNNTAIFDAGTKKTEGNGVVTFSVENANAGKFTVTASARSNGTTKTASQDVEFIKVSAQIADLSVNIVQNNKPATGNEADAIQIDVIARDSSNSPVANAPIIVQLSAGSAAIAQPATGVTDANGFFSTKVTSTVAGSVNATVGVELSSVSPKVVELKFSAGDSTTPTSMELGVVNSPQPADGESKITVIARPKDAKNAPISGVNIELFAERSSGANATAIFENATGTTDSRGEFRTTLTSTKAETLNITAIASGTVSVTETAKFETIGSEIKELTVNIENDKQAAGDPINVDVLVRDAGGRAVSGATITIEFPTGTKATASPAQGETVDGIFRTAIISTIAGPISFRAVVKGTSIVSSFEPIEFLPAVDATPDKVTLTIKKSPQPADGESKIELLVKTEKGGEAISKVSVELISESTNAVITPATGETNALGEFRASVTNAVAEKFKITPVAGGVTGDEKTVEFTGLTTNIPDETQIVLNVTTVDAQINEPAELVVVARRTDTDVPLANIPVTLSTPNTSARFLESFSGETNELGTFTSKITSTKTGTIKVKAIVEGTSIVSNEISLIFGEAGGSGEPPPEVETLTLLTSSPQLDSEGKAEGVILTAIVKDKDNHLISDVTVDFSADSGELQLISPEGSSALPGVTDVNGRAQARLTTEGDHRNREIKVIATIAGTELTKNLTIDVIGTVITVTGEDNIIGGKWMELDIALRDSAGNGIGKEKLIIESLEKLSTFGIFNNDTNLYDDTNLSKVDVINGTNGKIKVKVTANNVMGKDTIRVSAEGAIYDELDINISNNTLQIVPVGDVELDQLPINQPVELLVKSNVSGTVLLSTSRGSIPQTSITLRPPVTEKIFTIQSNNVGVAVITATVESENLLTTETVEFIAKEVGSVIIQAEPAVIGVNIGDSDVNQSEITATVRDPNSNLVKGKRVNFNVEDITSGRVFPSSAVTDGYGRARTSYIAGSSSSAAEGVKVIASVEGKSDFVNLTVAESNLFISVATGTTIVDDGEGRRYKKPYTVLVTDSNGTPVGNANITLSIHPKYYYKGYEDNRGADEEGNDIPKGSTIITAICENEDKNENGILDSDEDTNQNSQLDPGNIVTVDSLEIKTIETGFSDFYVVYAKQFARWVEVDLTARAAVEGSEAMSKTQFVTTCSVADVNQDLCPFEISPFGTSDTCADTR